MGEFKLSNLIIPLIQLIMFGMGASMSVNDFAAVVKSPKGVVIGVAKPVYHYALAWFYTCKSSLIFRQK